MHSGRPPFASSPPGRAPAHPHRGPILHQALKRFAARRLGFVIALASLACALSLYTSHENRQILGRYSVTYATVLAGVVALLVVAIAYAFHRRNRREAWPEAVMAQLALAAWGIAYLVAAVLDRRESGRLLDLNVVGSVTPAAVLIEWLAMAVMTIAIAIWIGRRIPAWARNAGLIAASLVVFALLGEGAARAKAIVAPTIMGVPTHSATIFTRRHVALNGDGYRDVEHAEVAPPGTKRLLLIGDSFAYGAGIRRLDDRFGEQLASILTEGTGRPWESICACRVDRHTLEELEFLRASIRYRPDAVVLLYVFNDIDYLADRMNFRPLTDRTSVLFEHPRSVAARLHPLRVAYWNSYLAQEVLVRLRLLGYRWSENASVDPYVEPAILEAHLRDLATLVEEARRSGALVGVVPFDPLASSDDRARARYDRFVTAARDAGIPVWPVRTALDGHPPAALTVNALDHHPSIRANRLAAEATSRYLLESLNTEPEKVHAVRSPVD